MARRPVISNETCPVTDRDSSGPGTSASCCQSSTPTAAAPWRPFFQARSLDSRCCLFCGCTGGGPCYPLFMSFMGPWECSISNAICPYLTHGVMERTSRTSGRRCERQSFTTSFTSMVIKCDQLQPKDPNVVGYQRHVANKGGAKSSLMIHPHPHLNDLGQCDL